MEKSADDHARRTQEKEKKREKKKGSRHAGTLHRMHLACERRQDGRGPSGEWPCTPERKKRGGAKMNVEKSLPKLDDV